MDAIDVIAYFDVHGKVTPMSFIWKNDVYMIESTGRRWETDDTLHILVMVPAGRIFELIYDYKEVRWYLERSKTERTVA